MERKNSKSESNEKNAKKVTKKLNEDELSQVKGGVGYIKIDGIDGEMSGPRRPYKKRP